MLGLCVSKSLTGSWWKRRKKKMKELLRAARWSYLPLVNIMCKILPIGEFHQMYQVHLRENRYREPTGISVLVLPVFVITRILVNTDTLVFYDILVIYNPTSIWNLHFLLLSYERHNNIVLSLCLLQI